MTFFYPHEECLKGWSCRSTKRECTMSEKMPCPNCAQLREVALTERNETVTIKGKEVTFPARFSRCIHCGEEFENPEQLDANLLAAREAYKARYESISPDALRELRAGYGASQKAFGLILGFGELTINTYEQGGVPTEPNRNLLRLARDPRVFRMLFEANKDKIGALQRRRIEGSAGFRQAAQWDGVEGLYDALSEEKRRTVEEAASRREMEIPRLVGTFLLPTLNREKLAVLQNDWEDRGWEHVRETSGCRSEPVTCMEGVGA